jgi:hypothetical protein
VAAYRQKCRGRSCNLPDPVCRHRIVRNVLEILAAIDANTGRIWKEEQK